MNGYNRGPLWQVFSNSSSSGSATALGGSLLDVRDGSSSEAPVSVRGSYFDIAEVKPLRSVASPAKKRSSSIAWFVYIRI
jgi:hypothetical protein